MFSFVKCSQGDNPQLCHRVAINRLWCTPSNMLHINHTEPSCHIPGCQHTYIQSTDTQSCVQLGSKTRYGLRSTKIYFFLKIFPAIPASAQSPNTPEISFLLSITGTKQLFLYVQLASSGKQFGG